MSLDHNQQVSTSPAEITETPGRARRAIDTWLGVFMPLVYGMLGAMMAILITQALYPNQPRIAAVDVLKIMDRFDAEAIEAINNGDAEAAKRAAERRAKRAAEIEVILDQLARKNGLVLVQKQAILGGEVTDMTDEVIMMLEQKQ